MSVFHPDDNVYLRQCQKRCGVIDEIRPVPAPTPLDRSYASNWNPEFERLMRNRLVMGELRYGNMHRKELWNVDYLGSMRSRMNRFSRDGNLEHLVDIANICLVLFTNPPPGCTFQSIDDGEHARVHPL